MSHSAACALCFEFAQAHGGVLGPLIGPLKVPTSHGKETDTCYVHRFCALWSAEVVHDERGLLKHVGAAVRRGRTLYCTECGRRGATVGCRVKTCTATFHLLCAQRAHCVFNTDQYFVACAAHAQQFRHERSQHKTPFPSVATALNLPPLLPPPPPLPSEPQPGKGGSVLGKRTEPASHRRAAGPASKRHHHLDHETVSRHIQAAKLAMAWLKQQGPSAGLSAEPVADLIDVDEEQWMMKEARRAAKNTARLAPIILAGTGGQADVDAAVQAVRKGSVGWVRTWAGGSGASGGAPEQGRSTATQPAQAGDGPAGAGGPAAGAGQDRAAGAVAPGGLSVEVWGADSPGFESLGGLPHVVMALREMALLPLLHPGLLNSMGIKPPRGILLYGIPGTGKTAAVRALAGECARAAPRPVSLFLRKGADCLGKFVGDAERTLRLLFQEASRLAPSIVFLDELDALAPARSYRESTSDQVHASVVSTLLSCMDGMMDRGQVLVIGATNRLDSIDPALRRPGRFDREVGFVLPDVEARADILTRLTRAWSPRPPPGLLQRIAQATHGCAGADLQALCCGAVLSAAQRTAPDCLDAPPPPATPVMRRYVKGHLPSTTTTTTNLANTTTAHIATTGAQLFTSNEKHSGDGKPVAGSQHGTQPGSTTHMPTCQPLREQAVNGAHRPGGAQVADQAAVEPQPGGAQVAEQATVEPQPLRAASNLLRLAVMGRGGGKGAGGSGGGGGGKQEAVVTGQQAQWLKQWQSVQGAQERIGTRLHPITVDFSPEPVGASATQQQAAGEVVARDAEMQDAHTSTEQQPAGAVRGVGTIGAVHGSGGGAGMGTAAGVVSTAGATPHPGKAQPPTTTPSTFLGAFNTVLGEFRRRWSPSNDTPATDCTAGDPADAVTGVATTRPTTTPGTASGAKVVHMQATHAATLHTDTLEAAGGMLTTVPSLSQRAVQETAALAADARHQTGVVLAHGQPGGPLDSSDVIAAVAEQVHTGGGVGEGGDGGHTSKSQSPLKMKVNALVAQLEHKQGSHVKSPGKKKAFAFPTWPARLPNSGGGAGSGGSTAVPPARGSSSGAAGRAARGTSGGGGVDSSTAMPPPAVVVAAKHTAQQPVTTASPFLSPPAQFAMLELTQSGQGMGPFRHNPLRSGQLGHVVKTGLDSVGVQGIPSPGPWTVHVQGGGEVTDQGGADASESEQADDLVQGTNTAAAAREQPPAAPLPATLSTQQSLLQKQVSALLHAAPSMPASPPRKLSKPVPHPQHTHQPAGVAQATAVDRAGRQPLATGGTAGGGGGDGAAGGKAGGGDGGDGVGDGGGGDGAGGDGDLMEVEVVEMVRPLPPSWIQDVQVQEADWWAALAAAAAPASRREPLAMLDVGGGAIPFNISPLLITTLTAALSHLAAHVPHILPPAIAHHARHTSQTPTAAATTAAATAGQDTASWAVFEQLLQQQGCIEQPHSTAQTSTGPFADDVAGDAASGGQQQQRMATSHVDGTNDQPGVNTGATTSGPAVHQTQQPIVLGNSIDDVSKRTAVPHPPAVQGVRPRLSPGDGPCQPCHVLICGSESQDLDLICKAIRATLPEATQVANLSLPSMVLLGEGDAVLGCSRALTEAHARAAAGSGGGRPGAAAGGAPLVVYMPCLELWAVESVTSVSDEDGSHTTQCEVTQLWNTLLATRPQAGTQRPLVFLATCSLPPAHLPPALLSIFSPGKAGDSSSSSMTGLGNQESVWEWAERVHSQSPTPSPSGAIISCQQHAPQLIDAAIQRIAHDLCDQCVMPLISQLLPGHVGAAWRSRESVSPGGSTRKGPGRACKGSKDYRRMSRDGIVSPETARETGRFGSGGANLLTDTSPVGRFSLSGVAAARQPRSLDNSNTAAAAHHHHHHQEGGLKALDSAVSAGGGTGSASEQQQQQLSPAEHQQAVKLRAQLKVFIQNLAHKLLSDSRLLRLLQDMGPPPKSRPNKQTGAVPWTHAAAAVVTAATGGPTAGPTAAGSGAGSGGGGGGGGSGGGGDVAQHKAPVMQDAEAGAPWFASNCQPAPQPRGAHSLIEHLRAAATGKVSSVHDLIHPVIKTLVDVRRRATHTCATTPAQPPVYREPCRYTWHASVAAAIQDDVEAAVSGVTHLLGLLLPKTQVLLSADLTAAQATPANLVPIHATQAVAQQHTTTEVHPTGVERRQPIGDGGGVASPQSPPTRPPQGSTTETMDAAAVAPAVAAYCAGQARAKVLALLVHALTSAAHSTGAPLLSATHLLLASCALRQRVVTGLGSFRVAVNELPLVSTEGDRQVGKSGMVQQLVGHVGASLCNHLASVVCTDTWPATRAHTTRCMTDRAASWFVV